jgi:hypothetical protein
MAVPMYYICAHQSLVTPLPAWIVKVSNEIRPAKRPELKADFQIAGTLRWRGVNCSRRTEVR